MINFVAADTYASCTKGDTAVRIIRLLSYPFPNEEYMLPRSFKSGG